MSIEVIVFIYIYICVCVVIFDLLFSIYRWQSDRILPRRIAKLEMQIRWHNLERNAHPAVSQRLRQTMERKLRKVNYLLPFSTALENLTVQNPEGTAEFVRDTIPQFLRLGVIYQKKSPEVRALFSYVIYLMHYGSKIPACTPEERGNVYSIANILLQFESDDSVYVRENAFKALLSIGNPHYVLEAVTRFSEIPAHHNEKLLSDDLLEFSGKHRLLLEGLWSRLKSFAPPVQVSVVNYLRLLPAGEVNPNTYCEVLQECLVSDRWDREVRLAAIRFFRKYRYEPAQKELIRMLACTDEQYWEFAAVSASALQNYPGERTIQALSEAVSSSNWYVRFNASESLIGLGIDQQAFYGRNQDAYAGEMMAYRSEVKKLKERNRPWIS